MVAVESLVERRRPPHIKYRQDLCNLAPLKLFTSAIVSADFWTVEKVPRLRIAKSPNRTLWFEVVTTEEPFPNSTPHIS
jgi:hypothetical protein